MTMAAGACVTVRDRILALGFKYPNKRVAWRLGNTVRDAWVERYGHLPEKMLLVKTSGTGSHCFATYPMFFVPTIDRCVRAELGEPRGLLPFARGGGGEDPNGD